MPFDRRVEHFVTLFDTNYLPAGLSLYRSMCKQAGEFRLWVLCMDEQVEACLRELNLPGVHLIPLREAETPALLALKSGRSAGEYCWTLTPFLAEFVMVRDRTVDRVTYLDADLYFFDEPRILLDEFEASGAHVLITEHAFAPEYARRAKAGIYCVQFMTFRNTPESMNVMRWWQDRCLEWCFNRYEDGKLGDQKYLDDWPVRFSGAVHVLQQKDRTLAPWNVAYFLDRSRALVPVFFHFQSFRVVSESKMRWYQAFRIGSNAEKFYLHYASEVRDSLILIRARWKMVPTLRDVNSVKDLLAKWYYTMTRTCEYRNYSLEG